VYDKGLTCRCQRTFAGGLHSTFQHFRQPPQKYKFAGLDEINEYVFDYGASIALPTTWSFTNRIAWSDILIQQTTFLTKPLEITSSFLTLCLSTETQSGKMCSFFKRETKDLPRQRGKVQNNVQIESEEKKTHLSRKLHQEIPFEHAAEIS